MRYFLQRGYRLSFAELWRACKGNPINFMFAVVFKIFRVSALESITPDPREFEIIPFEDIDSDLMEQVAPIDEDIRMAGFNRVHVHGLLADNSRGYLLAYLPNQGDLLYVITVSWILVQDIERVEVRSYFMTYLDRENITITGNKSPYFRPPYMRDFRVVSGNIETVLQAHRHRMQDERTTLSLSPADVPGLIRQNEEKITEWFIERGIYIGPYEEDELPGEEFEDEDDD